MLIDKFCVVCKCVPERCVSCPKCSAPHCDDCCGSVCTIYGCGTDLYVVDEPNASNDKCDFIVCLVSFWVLLGLLVLFWNFLNSYTFRVRYEPNESVRGVFVSGKLCEFDFKPDIVVYNSRNRTLTFSCVDGVKIGKGFIPFQSLTVFFSKDGRVSEIHFSHTTPDRDVYLGSYKVDEIRSCVISYQHCDTSGYIDFESGNGTCLIGKFSVKVM